MVWGNIHLPRVHLNRCAQDRDQFSNEFRIRLLRAVWSCNYKCSIQQLLDDLEASRQARRRAWDVLQDLRAVLTNLGNVTIEVPSRKTFEAEGAILKQALSDCLRNQRAALAQLADAARQVDKAAFGSTADFGPAHQVLLKALDRAEVLLQG